MVNETEGKHVEDVEHILHREGLDRRWRVHLDCEDVAVDTASPWFSPDDWNDYVAAAGAGPSAYAAWWMAHAGAWWSSLVTLPVPILDPRPWQQACLEEAALLPAY